MARSGTTAAARRYAEAAFELATRDSALDAYDTGLELATQLVGERRVLAVLRNPGLPLRDRIALVDRLLAGSVPEPVLKLVGLLVERGRIERLPDVAKQFRRLLNEQREVVEAVATAAAPLTDDETEALRQKIASMTGRTVDLRVEVDEALIGGLAVRVRDTLYDASVRGRLERLRQRLVAGAR